MNDSALIFESYKAIYEEISTEEKVNNILKEFDAEAAQNRYRLTEYLERMALLVHQYKESHFIAYELEGMLFRTFENEKAEFYEIDPNYSRDDEIELKAALKDIIAKGTQSEYWYYDGDLNSQEGSWNARDQENINDRPETLDWD